MSIIYDALKKVEPQTENGKRPSAPRRKSIFALGLLILLAAGFFLTALFKAKTPSVTPVSKSGPGPQLVYTPISPQPPKTLPPQPPAKPFRPQKTPSPKQDFILTGIFFSEDQGSALINDMIVNEGDSVGGATVTKITLKEVELQTAEKTINLTLSK